jgi:hypothetical protein
MVAHHQDEVPLDVREREAAAIRRLTDAHCAVREISRAQLVRLAGIGTPAVMKQWLSTARPLSLAGAVKLSAALSLPIDDFSPRLAAFVRDAHRHVRHDGHASGALIAAEPAPTYNVGPTVDWRKLAAAPPKRRELFERIVCAVAEQMDIDIKA